MLSVGAVVSWTVTVNDVVPALPCASCAAQATMVAPIEKVAPDAIGFAGTPPMTVVHAIGRTPSTLSTAVTVNVTTAPAALVASLVRSPGPTTVGPVVVADRDRERFRAAGVAVRVRCGAAHCVDADRERGAGSRQTRRRNRAVDEVGRRRRERRDEARRASRLETRFATPTS